MIDRDSLNVLEHEAFRAGGIVGVVTVVSLLLLWWLLRWWSKWDRG